MPLKRLSPSANKLLLLSPADERVSTLVQIAPSINRTTFERDVASQGGTIRSWMPEAGVASVEIDAQHLAELADLDGVIYVDAGQKYSL